MLTTLKKEKKTTKKRPTGADTERRDETECFRHLVLDLAPAPPDHTAGGMEGADGHNQPGSRATSTHTLPRLSNGRLLEHRDGSFHLRSSAFVVPYAASRPSAAAGATTADRDAHHALLEYVLVPYALGKQLYEVYDPNAPDLPSPQFKRYRSRLADATCTVSQ
jgi:hypothetical protein